jgi:hypothetical protein
MKNIFVAVLSIFTVLTLGCAQSSDSNNQQTTQTTATVLSTDCVTYPQNCNPNYYNNSYGFQPNGYYNNYYYNNNGYNPYNYSAGLCNCPSGTMPTYNAYSGMGCVNVNFANTGGFSAYAYFGVGYGYGANNSQWMNIPQVSNYVGYNQQNCYNGVVQSCATDQVNSCGNGYTCRASNAGSRLGLCVSNSSSSTGTIFR